MKKRFFCILVVIITICLTGCNNLSKYKDGLSSVGSNIDSSGSTDTSHMEDGLFSEVDDLSSIIGGLESGGNVHSTESFSSSSTSSSSNGTSNNNSNLNSESNSSESPDLPPVISDGLINYPNMKAVWIAYLEFGDFRGSSKEVFTANVKRMFSKSKNIGLNTVIVQVRPFGDSFYASQYYPWSRYISGTIGQGVDYDPVAIMVEEAHKLKLSVHAWINPYRIMTDSEIKTVNMKYKIRQWYTGSNNEHMILIKDRWWLKPGNNEVKSLITDGAKEIMQKYNVDGLHIDDYFYGTSIGSYGDNKQQAQANTTAMVQGLYNAVKAANKNKLFGVSPAGGFKQTIPDSDIKDLSTDLVKWCKNPGYIDYVMPQIYWDYNHPVAPFTTVFNKWDNFVTCESVALYPGLAPYKIPDKMSMNSIYKQIADISKAKKARGYALFRYDNIVNMNFN